jgi:hypothetical protein
VANLACTELACGELVEPVEGVAEWPKYLRDEVKKLDFKTLFCLSL